MVSHALTVQFWDNKEKCSNRSRSDKAKAFKLPADKSGNGHTSEMPDTVHMVICMLLNI